MLSLRPKACHLRLPASTPDACGDTRQHTAVCLAFRGISNGAGSQRRLELSGRGVGESLRALWEGNALQKDGAPCHEVHEVLCPQGSELRPCSLCLSRTICSSQATPLGTSDCFLLSQSPTS